MRLVFFGTPDFAVAPLKSLLESQHEVIAVVTQPDRQSGRGRKVHACPVKEEALKAGISVLQPEKVKDVAAESKKKAQAKMAAVKEQTK